MRIKRGAAPDTVAVTGCHDCPFHDEYADPWTCVTADSDIPRKRYFNLGPPSWCPLRKADHLVTLRVK